MTDSLYLGLISGTSMDGIDAVILKTGASAQVIASSLTPYSPQLKARLNQLVTQGQGSLDELGELSVAVGVEFAAAANALIVHNGGLHDLD